MRELDGALPANGGRQHRGRGRHGGGAHRGRGRDGASNSTAHRPPGKVGQGREGECAFKIDAFKLHHMYSSTYIAVNPASTE